MRLLAALLALCGYCWADPLAKLERKLFPALASMEKLEDPVLDSIGKAKLAALNQGPGGLRWTEAEIESAGAAIAHAGGVKLDQALREGGHFERYRDLAEGALAARVWADAARAMNLIYDVYAEGKGGRYPAIDSAAFDVKAPSYSRMLSITGTVISDGLPAKPDFYHVPLQFALHLLDANARDEAVRFEPLETGENRAARDAVRITQWEQYPYTAIVVPGSGTDRPAMAMSPWGKLRLRLAAKRYFAGKAPFLIVSGGYVHPAQTPFNEALEMKKALMRGYGVPEAAILIEPHARHTTTNLRNAARLMFRYGMPAEKKALITTDPGQSAYIFAGAGCAARGCDGPARSLAVA